LKEEKEKTEWEVVEFGFKEKEREEFSLGWKDSHFGLKQKEKEKEELSLGWKVAALGLGVGTLAAVGYGAWKLKQHLEKSPHGNC
jgi:hypothetical protein